MIILQIDMRKHSITNQNKNYSNVIELKRMIQVYLRQFGICMMLK